MANPDTVLVPLADGFEEIEAVTIIDVLRRAEIPVVVAGLAPGPVTGSHGLTLATDATLDEVEAVDLCAVVLPGGMPGTTNLMADTRLLGLLKAVHGAGGDLGAICAAPMVLAEAGLLGAGPATSHPSVRDRLGEAEVVDAPRVITADRVLTSQGAGTAMEFALALVGRWCGPEKAAELGRAMVVATP